MLAVRPSHAQVTSVTAFGPITPGDCAYWFSRSQIADWGSGCGGGSGGGNPGGATDTVQFNAGAGNFGGITDWKTNGTTQLNGLAGAILDMHLGSQFIPPQYSGSEPVTAGVFTFDTSTFRLYGGDGTVAQKYVTTSDVSASATGPGILRQAASVGGAPPVLTAAELSGDCTTSASNAVTCTKINGVAFAGTNGDVVGFGAGNTPADTGFLATNVVRKDTTNTGAAAMTLDMSASTGSNALKVPVKSGVTTTVNGAIGYDSSTDMLHAAQAGADAQIPQTTATPANTDCVTWVVSGSKYKLGTAGSPCGSGSGGGGVVTYSDNGVTVTANTYFAPIGGGGAPQTTEGNVDVASPAAATVANLQVGISTTLGAGTSVVVTLRDTTTTGDTALTCTINSAATTTCQDVTHSVNISKNDVIDWKIVTSGTIVGTPTVTISAAFGTSNVGVTSIATTGPITGGPISTTGTISCPTCVVTAAPTTDATSGRSFSSSDCGTTVLRNNATIPATDTIPQAGTASITSSCVIVIQNIQANSNTTQGGIVQLTPSTSTINVPGQGALARIFLLPGQSATITNDGSNYYATITGPRVLCSLAGLTTADVLATDTGTYFGGITGTNAGTSIHYYGKQCLLPANFIAVAGQKLRIIMSEEETSSSSSVPTQGTGIAFCTVSGCGSGTTPVVTSVTGANATSLTNVQVGQVFDVITESAAGSAATVDAFISLFTLNQSGGRNTLAPVSVATNAAQYLGVSNIFGSTTAGNAYGLRGLTIEVVN